MTEFVRTDGTNAMEAGYTPTRATDVVTLEALNLALAGTTGNSAFLTTAASIPNTASGKPYIFQFQYVGNQSTYLLLEGYNYPYSIKSGAWVIQDPVPGTYNMTAYLNERLPGDLDGMGRTLDSFTFTFSVTQSPTDIGFVSAGALTMPDFTFGQTAAWPITFTGIGPIQLRLKSGSMQPGVNLITSQLLTPAEAGVSTTVGTPQQEGAGAGSVVIVAAGATGVSVSATASVSNVLRAPEFVGLVTLPVFPASGSGVYSLSPFIRGYPAPTLRVGTSLDTIQAGLSLSGYDILYTQPLISLAGTTSSPVVFELVNASSQSTTVQLTFRVQSSGTLPVAGTIFSWSARNEPTSVSGATVSTFNDIAQGTALQMRVADGIASGTGPTWDQTARAAQFRHSAKSTLGGLGIDGGLYPNTVTMRAKILSTTQTGTRQLAGASNESVVLNIGTGGASTVAYLGTARTVKAGGSAVTSNRVYLSLSSQPAGVALLVGWPAGTGNISTVTVSSASSGGTTVPLSLAAAITGSNCLTQIYWVGDNIPPIGAASALWINVVYAGSDGTGAMLTGVGVRGSQNMRVVDAKTLASTGTNASVTLSKSGVQALVLSSLCGRIGSATDLTIIGGNTQLAAANDFGAALAIAGYQTTVGSANAAAGWSTSAASWAVAAIAVAESGGAATRALGLAVSGQANYTTVLSADALYDVWNSYIFHWRNLSQGSVRVNATVYSISGTAVGGTLNDFYLGGATGADYDLRAVRVHYGAFDVPGSQGTAEIAYLSAQDTAAQLSVSTSVAPSTALLDTDSRLLVVTNAWRGNAWHSTGPRLQYFNTSAAKNKQFLNVTPNSGLTVPNSNNTVANAKLVFTRVTGAGSVDTASGRIYYQLQIDDNTQAYAPGSSIDDTVRIGLGPGYLSNIVGNTYWHGCDFVLDPSMYAKTPYPSTWNLSFQGIHPIGGPGGTDCTFAFQSEGAGFGYLRITPRRHPLNTDGTLNTGAREELTQNLTAYPLTGGHRYVMVYRWKLDPETTATGFLRIWLRQDATWLNNGNPILDYTGRFGYRLTNTRREPRNFPAIYNWAHAFSKPTFQSCWPVTVNNIIDSGNRGFRLWASKGISIRDTAGTPTLNRDVIAGFIDSLTDGS